MTEVFLEKEGGNSAGTSVTQVRLYHYRNYPELDLTLAPGLNVLYGQNAQGKTNLLEALYLLSSTRLLRGSKDAEAILEGESQARVSAELAPSRTELAIVLEAGKRKIASLNKVGLPRAADLIGRLPSVCISAFDMEIVRGSPDSRRLFLDMELSQLSVAYLNHLAAYKRALEQRNALLRRSQDELVESLEFEPWEAVLAEHGAAIRAARQSLVAALTPHAQALQSALALEEALRLSYEPKDEARAPEEALRALQTSRTRDVARGSTSVGPHRDDLAIFVQNRDARYFGSQGQQRTAVLALKLAACLHYRESKGEMPLLLLDDILSDLDESRRRSLVAWIVQNARQALLTCTEPAAAGPGLLEKATLFRVESGRIAAE